MQKRETTMRNKKKSTKNRLTSLPVLPHPSSADLRGKQSVRSTFRLSQSAINMLSIVSTHLGIKQKSLFDHLMEDMDSLSQIAQEILPEYPEPSLKIQKTYVLSRKTVISLDSVCKNYKTPRDALVEYSIHRLLPVIEKEKEKHRKRKEISKDLVEYLELGKIIYKKSLKTLGEEDLVHERLAYALNTINNAYRDIEAFIERGETIKDL